MRTRIIQVHSGSYNVFLYMYNEANLVFYFSIYHFGQIISEISPHLKKKCEKTPKIHCNIYIYVTVNMCNQGIRVFPEIFSEYAYSPKWSGNTRIPWFCQVIASHIH